jgi:hypothetical protein
VRFMKFNARSGITGWFAAVLYGTAAPGQAEASRGWQIIGQLTRQGVAVLLSALMIMIPMGQEAFAQQAPDAAPPAADQQQQAPPQAQPLSADQLNQLVAPIALYPDALVAQVLAASTYPTQVVEADRWRQAQGNAPAEQVANGADAQNWDPSVKALTAFPTVLAQMDRNLQWTTDLGNAYYNQPQDVMDSVQAMRQKAQASGQLRSTPQQTVTVAPGGPIAIAPANPAVVYVPAYDPWAVGVWGYPFAPFPGYFYAPPPGIFWGGLAIGFGIGIGIGLWGHWGWGWGHWGMGWGHGFGGYGGRGVYFNHANYYTRSTTVINRGFNRPGGPGRGFGARGAYARPAGGFNRAGGASAYRGSAGARTGAAGVNRPAGNYARPGGAAAGRAGGTAAGRPAGAASRSAAAPRSSAARGPSGGGRPSGGGSHPGGGSRGGGGHSSHGK